MAAFHNLMGYRLMQKEDMEGALAHFQLQTRLLPDANCMDSSVILCRSWQHGRSAQGVREGPRNRPFIQRVTTQA